MTPLSPCDAESLCLDPIKPHQPNFSPYKTSRIFFRYLFKAARVCPLPLSFSFSLILYCSPSLSVPLWSSLFLFLSFPPVLTRPPPPLSLSLSLSCSLCMTVEPPEMVDQWCMQTSQNGHKLSNPIFIAGSRKGAKEISHIERNLKARRQVQLQIWPPVQNTKRGMCMIADKCTINLLLTENMTSRQLLLLSLEKMICLLLTALLIFQ